MGRLIVIPRLIAIIVISPMKSLFVTVSACAEIPFAEFPSQMLGKVECLPWTWGKTRGVHRAETQKYIVTMHKTAPNCDNGSNLPIASTLTPTSLWGSVCVHWSLQLALRGFRLCMLGQAPHKPALNLARFAMPCLLFPLAGL